MVRATLEWLLVRVTWLVAQLLVHAMWLEWLVARLAWALRAGPRNIGLGMRLVWAVGAGPRSTGPGTRFGITRGAFCPPEP